MYLKDTFCCHSALQTLFTLKVKCDSRYSAAALSTQSVITASVFALLIIKKQNDGGKVRQCLQARPPCNSGNKSTVRFKSDVYLSKLLKSREKDLFQTNHIEIYTNCCFSC